MKRCITTEYSDVDFTALIESTVKKVLQQSLLELAPHLSNSPPEKLSEKLLDRKSVCELLKISLPTIAKLQREGKIRGVIVGGAYRYKKADVLAFINGTK